MSEITVLTFGAVAEIVGENHLQVEAFASTDDLKANLESRYPALKGLPYAVAVDKQLITGSAPLQGGATVALLPPFSGG